MTTPMTKQSSRKYARPRPQDTRLLRQALSLKQGVDAPRLAQETRLLMGEGIQEIRRLGHDP